MSAMWVVSFSDGKRLSMRELFNGDGVNPWDKAIAYRKNNKVEITHLNLNVNGKWYNSPSLTGRHRSTDFSNLWIFYRQSSDIDGNGASENYMCYSYRAGDYRHFFWTNTENNFCYSQVLNIVHPSVKEERDFAGIEKDIERAYAGDT
jgi:hypothetical protein